MSKETCKQSAYWWLRKSTFNFSQCRV